MADEFADWAVMALSALAHESRLQVHRLLVQAGEAGLSAGAIAERLNIPASSLSFHLTHMQAAEMVLQRREGRSLIYSANFESHVSRLPGPSRVTAACRVGMATSRSVRPAASRAVGDGRDIRGHLPPRSATPSSSTCPPPHRWARANSA